MRLSKWWQKFKLGLNYPFTIIFNTFPPRLFSFSTDGKFSSPVPPAKDLADPLVSVRVLQPPQRQRQHHWAFPLPATVSTFCSCSFSIWDLVLLWFDSNKNGWGRRRARVQVGKPTAVRKQNCWCWAHQPAAHRPTTPAVSAKTSLAARTNADNGKWAA